MTIDDKTFQTLAANLRPANSSCCKYPYLQVWMNGYDLEVTESEITLDYDAEHGWETITLTKDQIEHLDELLEAEREQQRFYETTERIAPYYWHNELRRG